MKLQFHRKYYKLKKERNKKIIRSHHWWISRTVPKLLPNCLNCYLDSWYEMTLQDLYIKFKNDLFIRIIIGIVWIQIIFKIRVGPKKMPNSLDVTSGRWLTDEWWLHRVWYGQTIQNLHKRQTEESTVWSKCHHIKINPVGDAIKQQSIIHLHISWIVVGLKFQWWDFSFVLD